MYNNEWITSARIFGVSCKAQIVKTEHLVLSLNKKCPEKWFTTVQYQTITLYWIFLELASRSAKLKRSFDFGSKELGDLYSTPLDGSSEVHTEIVSKLLDSWLLLLHMFSIHFFLF